MLRSITSWIYRRSTFTSSRRRALPSSVMSSDRCSERICRLIYQHEFSLYQQRPQPDLATLFDSETKEIKKLLAPGMRRHAEVEAKLRSLAIVESR